MSAKRFVIEAEWLGYRSSQDRIVHRMAYPASFRKLRAWAEKTHAIMFTDGTRLRLSVRDCKPRERVSEIRGYTSLINDCAHYDVNTVHDLSVCEELAKTKRGEPEPVSPVPGLAEEAGRS